MPKLQEKSEKVRLNLEISSKVRNKLDDLVERSESTSVTEVIRKALAAYDLFLEHTREGGDIVLRHSDGDEETLKIL